MLHSGRDVLTDPIDRAADHRPEAVEPAPVGTQGRPRPGLPLDGATEVSRPAVADAVVTAAAGDRGAFEEYHRTRDALSAELRDVTERIAGYRWDHTEVYGLLYELSAAQRAENRWLASKEPAGVASDSFKAA